MKIEIELAELRGREGIHLTFPFDPAYVRKAKSVTGASFVSREKGGPAWRYPKDIQTCHELRRTFGDALSLGPAIRAWAQAAINQHQNLASLSVGDDATLTRVPADLANWMRPYQRADAAFMAQSTSPMNANQPGLGKTAEVIASVFESGLMDGPNLVIAPLTSLDVVWAYELNRWQPYTVLIAPPDPEGRIGTIQLAQRYYNEGTSFWLVVNPAMVTYRAKRNKDTKQVEEQISPYPALHEIVWNTITLDEFHKMGLGNPSTLTSQAVNNLTALKRIAMSGTPIGGKPIKVFGVLHYLDPDTFSSKWRFADQWLEINAGYAGHKTIGQIRKDREDAFYDMLAGYMVRRTKAEVLSQLPPKQYVEIWAELEGKQKAQYRQFALDAEIRIEEENLSATSVLAEYTRLRQFADATQTVERIPATDTQLSRLILHATEDSCKLPHVMRLLDERGITGDEDAAGNAQVVIFSQFSEVVKMVHSHLLKHKIPAEKLTGDTPRAARSAMVGAFQAGNGPRVLVMTTTAGGVAVTLDRADTVIFLDETWNPDDQEQAEDRVHRASRIHQVTVYYIRSKGTLEEFVQQLTIDKSIVNEKILDLRRKGLKSI